MVTWPPDRCAAHPIIVQVNNRGWQGSPSLFYAARQGAVQILGKGSVNKVLVKKAYRRNSFHRPAANIGKPLVENGRPRGKGRLSRRARLALSLRRPGCRGPPAACRPG